MKPIFSDLKNSMTPYATYYAFFMTSMLPFYLPITFITDLVDKLTFTWSNVVCLKKPL